MRNLGFQGETASNETRIDDGYESDSSFNFPLTTRGTKEVQERVKWIGNAKWVSLEAMKDEKQRGKSHSGSAAL